MDKIRNSFVLSIANTREVRLCKRSDQVILCLWIAVSPRGHGDKQQLEQTIINWSKPAFWGKCSHKVEHKKVKVVFMKDTEILPQHVAMVTGQYAISFERQGKSWLANQKLRCLLASSSLNLPGHNYSGPNYLGSNCTSVEASSLTMIALAWNFFYNKYFHSSFT